MFLARVGAATSADVMFSCFMFQSGVGISALAYMSQ